MRDTRCDEPVAQDWSYALDFSESPSREVDRIEDSSSNQSRTHLNLADANASFYRLIAEICDHAIASGTN